MPFFLYITDSGEVTNSSESSFAPLPVGRSEIQSPNPSFDIPWVVRSGSIAKPNPADIAAFPAARFNLDIAESRLSAENLLNKADSDLGQVTRALALVTLDEINALRVEHGLALKTSLQFMSDIQVKLSSGFAD